MKSRVAKLNELIGAEVASEAVPETCVSGLTVDSREVVQGDVFFAVSGARVHGLRFAEQAIAKGAAAIVYDPRGVTSDDVDQIKSRHQCPLIALPALRFELGAIADRFYGHPSGALELIGITGTNGKTSCCHFLTQALSKFEPSGVIGTIGWGSLDNLQAVQNTTPEPLLLQKMLAQFQEQGTRFVAMEVSSHSLVQKRTRAVRFVGAVFTNITRDHLDYHKTMRVYVNAKLKLLLSPGIEFVVVNLDDRHADQILTAVPPHVRIMGFSKSLRADSPFVRLKLSGLRHDNQGVEFKVHYEGRSVPVSAPFFCDFNVDNLLTVLSVMLELGISLKDSVEALQSIKPVPGRLERLRGGESAPTVIIDYAHTPHALQSILAGLRMHCNGALWVVFGCGGDRDRGKRPLMGRIAEMHADQVILTDDNPRYEDGSKIIKEILKGCNNPRIPIERDRRQAIFNAIANASPADMVVIAGKGHENTQEIEGQKIPFNDRETVLDAFERLAVSPGGSA